MVPTLETMIEDNGAKFNSGQKQLLCLARAAVTQSKILLLDEATANIDEETAKRLHDVIEDIFYEYTILNISHKLQPLLEYDRVFVIDDGNIVENDNPKNLISNKDSIFHHLYRVENVTKK